MKHLWNQSSYRCHDAASIVGKSPSKKRDNRVLSVDDFSSSLQLAKRFGFFLGFLNEPRAAEKQRRSNVWFFNHWEE
jgi:hypothetical protein